jgi:hypothetical protein
VAAAAGKQELQSLTFLNQKEISFDEGRKIPSETSLIIDFFSLNFSYFIPKSKKKTFQIFHVCSQMVSSLKIVDGVRPGSFFLVFFWLLLLFFGLVVNRTGCQLLTVHLMC